MVFGFIPGYFYSIIGLIGSIFLILGGIKMRKENEEFNHSSIFIIVGMISIIYILVNYLLVYFIYQSTVFEMSLRNIIGSLMGIVIGGISFMFIELNNKEQEGNWLVWAGFLRCISSIVAIIMWGSFLVNCAFLSYEEAAAYCMFKMFDDGFKYIQYISFSFMVVSSLFFLVFSKKFNQKFLIISAIIGLGINLMILIDITYPTTFNF